VARRRCVPPPTPGWVAAPKEYMGLEYVFMSYAGWTQSEYIIRIIAAAPQEYVKIDSTRRMLIPTRHARSRDRVGRRRFPLTSILRLRRLGLIRTSERYCWSVASLYCPLLPPKPDVLQYYCTTIAQYTPLHRPPPPCYAIQHTILVMAVSG